MISQILRLILLVPDLIRYAKEVVAWAQAEFGPDWDQALLDLGKGFALLPKAQTPEERKAALDAISKGFNATPTRK